MILFYFSLFLWINSNYKNRICCYIHQCMPTFLNILDKQAFYCGFFIMITSLQQHHLFYSLFQILDNSNLTIDFPRPHPNVCPTACVLNPRQLLRSFLPASMLGNISFESWYLGITSKIPVS